MPSDEVARGSSGTEHRVLANERVLDALIEVATDAIKMIDLDGRIVRWNPAAEYFYGWESAEVLGKLLPHVPESMRLRAVQDIRAIAAAGRPVTREATAVRKNRTRIAVRLTVIPLLDDDGHPSAVLSVASEPARIAPASESDSLIATLAGELRAPLTAVVGYAQLLGRTEILEDPARRTRTVRALEERSAVLADLADDVLLLAQMRDGSFAIEREPADLTALVTDAVARLEGLRTGRRFAIHFDSGVRRVPVDQRRIRHAIEILLEAVALASDESSEVVVAIGTAAEDVVVSMTGGELAGPGAIDPGAVPGSETSIRRRVAAGIAEAHGGSVSDESRGPEPRLTLRIPVQ